MIHIDKYVDKYTVSEPDVWEYNGETFTTYNMTIKELYGIGAIIFSPPLELRIVFDGTRTATVHYGFGLSDDVSLEPGWLDDYAGPNPNNEPVKKVFSLVKFDLMHAFHHYSGDPNYGKIHWALYGNLRDCVDTFDYFEWDEEVGYNIPTQLEFNFS